MTMPATLTVPSREPVTDACGGRLVATDGRVLPLRHTAMSVHARGGVARTTLRQEFANPHGLPLEVSYQLPLPAEGAVSGFSFRLDGERIVGRVERRQDAREAFERALLAGKSAALLEQDRTSLFTQRVGNIPAGATVQVEIVIDQRLRWLEEGAWEWRFPTVVAPRYLGADGRVGDAARLEVEVATSELGARAALELRIGDELAEGSHAESPSHALCCTSERAAELVRLAEEAGARLDRDVVVRWQVARARIGTTVVTAQSRAGDRLAGRAFGLLTVVPPAPGARAEHPSVPRDLIVLLDVSGSMAGEPLAQARRVTLALLDTLTPADRLELIAFSWRVTRWQRGPVASTAAALDAARTWLGELEASGGTEMKDGILEALGPLRAEAQRQVVLVSDGLIGFEEEIVRAIAHDLPAGSRLHTVGVGSAVNRSLTGPAARAGRGVEIVLGVGEDVERAAQRLVARTAAPVVVELTVEGDAVRAHRPARLPDLFAGCPVLVPLELDPRGGRLVVRGRTAGGEYVESLELDPLAEGDGPGALATLYGREAVEDLELLRATGEDHEEAITALGLDFQLGTRTTSWVAVSERATVDPRDATRRETMPHELPHGMSVAGLGLRRASAAPMMRGAPPMQGAPMAVLRPTGAPPAGAVPAGRAVPAFASAVRARVGAPFPRMAVPPSPARPAEGDEGRIATPAPEPEDLACYELAPPPPPPAPAPGAPARPGVAQRLREGALRLLRGAELVSVAGRIVQEDEAGLVIELTLPVALAWEPRELRLVLADGCEVAVALVGERSTRAGERQAGDTVRIALRFVGPGLRAAPATLRLESGKLAVAVTLTAGA